MTVMFMSLVQLCNALCLPTLLKPKFAYFATTKIPLVYVPEMRVELTKVRSTLLFHTYIVFAVTVVACQ